MSAYFKYGFIAITKQMVTTVIVVLQLSLFFISLNIVIGNYNSRDMLCIPFSDILSKEGYYISIDRYIMTELEDGNVSMESRNIEETLNDLTTQLKGNLKNYRIYTGIVHPSEDSDVGLHLVFIDDEIYNKMTLPLLEGTWVNSADDKMCGVITHSRNQLNVNDSVEYNGETFTVSGVLTDITYVPDFDHFTAGSGIKNFYVNHSYETAQYDYMLLPLSAIGSGHGTPSHYSILVFDDTLSEADRQYNENVLSTAEVGHKVELSEIKMQSDIFLNEDLSKSAPLIVCAWIIAISGLITSCAIQIQKNLRDYAVFYLCGSKWSECLLINLISSLIVTFASAIISASFLFILSLLGFGNEAGIVIFSNNIYISLLICLISVGLSLIIPAFILKNNSAKKILNEMN